MSGAFDLTKAKKNSATTAPAQQAMPLSNSAPVPVSQDAARKLVKQTVELAESEVASLRGGVLDRSLGPDAVAATVGHRIARLLEQMNAVLDETQLEPGELTALAERLDIAIGTLFVLARKHGLPMRETFLEEVFDREDAFRRTHTVFAPTNRADNYYAADFVPIQRTHDTAPTAQALEGELENGDDRAKPRDRDDLIAQVLGFSNDLRSALDVAFHDAEGTIREPNAPKRPDLVERLLEMAMNVLSAQATSALGALIGAGLKLGEAKSGAGEHLGSQLTETLIDGFKDAGKENSKVTMQALGTIGMEAPKSETGLSAKTLYLNAAKQRTADAMDMTSRRFMKNANALKRVPVETLQALQAAFNDNLKKRIRDTYNSLLIHEWVNFGKAAAEGGEEMRDADKRPAHPSKFDQGSDPYGVLRIAITTNDAGRPEFQRADIPGIGDAVLAHIRTEKDQTLGTIPLHRRVEMSPVDSISLPRGAFDVDTAGKISAELDRLDPTARAAWARLANHPSDVPATDGDVYRGMYASLRWLGGIPCSRIEGGGE